MKNAKISNVLSTKVKRYTDTVKGDAGYVLDHSSASCIKKIIAIILCSNGNMYPMFNNGVVSFNKLFRRNKTVHISEVADKNPCNIIACFDI